MMIKELISPPECYYPLPQILMTQSSYCIHFAVRETEAWGRTSSGHPLFMYVTDYYGGGPGSLGWLQEFVGRRGRGTPPTHPV